jgi:hypothetical protein
MAMAKQSKKPADLNRLAGAGVGVQQHGEDLGLDPLVDTFWALMESFRRLIGAGS